MNTILKTSIKGLNNAVLHFTVIFAFCISCNKQKTSCYVINKEYAKLWISDSIGCLGDRGELVRLNKIQYTKFLNKDVSCLDLSLGKPNAKPSDANYTYYYYMLSCKYAPPIKYNNIVIDKKILSRNVKALMFKIDSKGIVKKASVVHP